MALGFLRRLAGDSNQKEISRLKPIVDEINGLADEMAGLSEEELAAITVELREQLANGDTLDDILPEAFAAAREMAFRKVGERPYDVQLMGGIVLHEGRIAEMRTGEGKTLTAVLPVYLNALEGKGVHVITVNDYLARRDAAWYGPVYRALGLTLGVVQHNGVSYLYDPDYTPEGETSEDNEKAAASRGGLRALRPCTRQEAYAQDITYGTNNEYGFDYLRDNMVKEAERQVQRGLHYAIVDEVDNILIDESRTPLIISGAAEEAAQTYVSFARAVRGLSEGEHFEVDYKSKHVALTEEGIEAIEQRLGIDNVYGGDAKLARHLEAALDAEYLKQVDRDYVVRDGEIVIVDEFTGRMMPGRRWSHGIHQAVEAKEGVTVQRESVTYATITFQNLFRMYDKLAGMTGTAETEAEEFAKIYNLEVVVIPTNRPLARVDSPDIIYLNEKAKFAAVANEIEELNKAGRPVLVGTTSIEKSEYLAELLKRRGIRHEVLNAKQHEREANIIGDAGARGAVTIATNMAGRGTDIKLAPGVADLGGLHVIGTERHESRRIDNQLRGRAGRQGDPGSSQFFVSFGDDIMRRFAPDWVPKMMAKAGMNDDVPLESKMVGRSIEQAQSKVEGHNFDIRKRLVEFDDVTSEHRRIIYEERDKVLRGDNTRDIVLNLYTDEIEAVIARADRETESGLELLHTELSEYLFEDDMLTLDEIEDLGAELVDEVLDRAEDRYEKIEELVGEENMRKVERWLLLEAFDYHWRQHLTAVEETRHSIGLQAYAQVDPLVAFKREGYDMFRQLQGNIRRQVARSIFRVKVQANQAAPAAQANQPTLAAQSAAQRPATESSAPVTVSTGPQTGPADSPAPATSGAVAQPIIPTSSSTPLPSQMRTNRSEDGETVAPSSGRGSTATATRTGPKVGRNDPCHCGSGKKFKKCHGAL